MERRCLHVLLDRGLEGGGVGTDNGGDLLAVLEEHEGGHGTDAQLLGDLGELVDVNLVETGAGVCGGHPVGHRQSIVRKDSARENSLDDLRGDGLAGTAPGGEEVDDHEGAGLSTSRVEVGLAVESVSCSPCIVRASLVISQALGRVIGRIGAYSCSMRHAQPATRRQLDSEQESLLTPGGCGHRRKPLKR